jgi:hypothetical protein
MVQEMRKVLRRSPLALPLAYLISESLGRQNTPQDQPSREKIFAFIVTTLEGKAN